MILFFVILNHPTVILNHPTVILNLIQDLPEDLPHIPSGDCGSSPQ